MKPLAVFTIARNEAFFLPKWVEYYGRLKADLHVLDHESNDGSTDIDGFVRVPVEREHTDDCGWMLRTVEYKFKELLNTYRRVIFAEVDEFLIPDPDTYPSLQNYLENHYTATPITATGYDVCWQQGDAYNPALPMMCQRKWKRNDAWDKTLISGIPLCWEVGFHRPQAHMPRPDPDPSLLLVHLHYADREIAWMRIQSRMAGRMPYPNDWGAQNKIRDRDAWDLMFSRAVADATEVPEKWKKLL